MTNKSVRGLSKVLLTKKIGHTGILDPLASGLVIVATDYDTKLLEYINHKNKIYIANSKFNLGSDTLDIDGELRSYNFPKIKLEELKKAIETVSKRQSQIPPKFSSKKINGQHAYKLAREGKEFELKPQKIKVLEYELISFDYDKQEYEIMFNVSEGTYIRTLLYDISLELNNSSVMTSLKRIGVGKILLDNLEIQKYEKISFDLLFDINSISLTEEIYIKVFNGQSFRISKKDENVFFIKNINNDVCCVGKIKDNFFYPKKVFKERLLWK
ncbi:tRNA pseudouridine(55) synthase TruB [Mycoplasma sp. CSL10137]|nr:MULTISPECIES: tRNA pseudouridine(55) synthase TruB [unclassified Mycoplasma]MBN4083741.1 tRNA pseudouridine(55) synthase TruB [Mycoplasma sp. CSL10137]MBN4084627.1 tRNA pseudouridine(55) synthase TruB [Mycoplasma sp. CSL10166]MBU4693105.1 tRNA pseudouridine(55) synthase TruB [Mycoplasma sp. CSL7491-lung]